uniref:Cytochrome-b5 reductase n=1 Tax=Parascaris univalens TaxID=6257 RepID=A0A915B897_PARUN
MFSEGTIRISRIVAFIREKMYVQVDRSERTVRALGMSYLLDCDFIYDLFSEIGPVEKVVFREHPDGSPKDALIVFRNKASVRDAIRNLHRREVYGALLIVRPLRSSGHHIYRDVDVSAEHDGADPYPTEPQRFVNGTNAEYFPQGGQVGNTGLGVCRSR